MESTQTMDREKADCIEKRANMHRKKADCALEI